MFGCPITDIVILNAVIGFSFDGSMEVGSGVQLTSAEVSLMLLTVTVGAFGTSLV